MQFLVHIAFFYLVPALLRDCSLYWDHWEVILCSDGGKRGWIYHTQAGFDPPFAEGAEFTE